jgi:hypothetical protein
MTDRRSPFNSPRASGQTPFWLRNGTADRADIERFEADHRRRLGMDRVRIQSPSAICALIGCKRRELHEHEVIE